MIQVKRINTSFSVSLDEVVSNGGLHEIFTKDGSVRFFLCDGEKMSIEHKKLLVANKELNIMQVPVPQQAAMSKYIEKLSRELSANT